MRVSLINLLVTRRGRKLAIWNSDNNLINVKCIYRYSRRAFSIRVPVMVSLHIADVHGRSLSIAKESRGSCHCVEMISWKRADHFESYDCHIYCTNTMYTYIYPIRICAVVPCVLRREPYAKD